MGNYCSVCGANVATGKYCNRCYWLVYPSCNMCGGPLLSNQEIVGSYHKFPCFQTYTQMCGQCLECGGRIDYNSNGTYCRNCYDSKYPPPLRVRGMYNGSEIYLYLRDDEVVPRLQPLAYAYGRGLSDGGQQGRFLTDF